MKGRNKIAPIYQTNKTYHTDSNATHRILSKPTFEGVVKKGGKYLITHDVVTAGSTVAASPTMVNSQLSQATTATTPSSMNLDSLYRLFN